MNKHLTFKNKITGKAEIITQYDLEIVDWGFHFFVSTELDAYKAAYQYRNNKYGTRVEWAEGRGQYLVTVFNELAEKTGLNK